MFSLFALLAASVASAAVHSKPCGFKGMRNLVAFGDSYTDESRLGYFFSHNGSAPPPGLALPPSNKTETGGLTWGRMVAEMTGAQYHNYAVSGASCSNEIINRFLSDAIGPFPSVLEYEVPAFEADTQYQSLYADRQPDNTVYALWIGTNDLGWRGFLSDSQASGTTISDFVDCVWDVFDRVYQAGGRYFVVLNEAPLQYAPTYAAPSIGGAGDNQYWTDKTTYNTTEYQFKMLEYTTGVNTMLATGAPFNLLVEQRWPGATFSILDVHRLMLDIRDTPESYLASPANVTGFYRHCNNDRSSCSNSENPYSSFLWNDELHPTQVTEEFIAKEFVSLVNGDSKYGKTYRS